MPHVRQQIRDAVIEQLQELEAIGYTVSARHFGNLAPDEIPAVIVRMATPNERSEAVSMGHDQPVLERVSTLSIAAIVNAEDEYLDDRLEAAAELIESSVDQFHGGLAKSTILSETSKEFSTVEEKAIAAITLDYAVTYHTGANAPSIAL